MKKESDLWKLLKSPKGSPRSIKLYGSSSILGLLADHREVPPLAADDWGHINACLLANRS
jgi:hypothetical protein